MIFPFIALLALVSAAPAPPLQALAGSPVPAQYIVVLRDDLIQSAVENHFRWLSDHLRPYLPSLPLFGVEVDSADLSALADDHNAMHPVAASGFLDGIYGIVHIYSLDGFNGYAARLPTFLVNLLKDHIDVLHIEEDRIVTIFGTQSKSPSWGLTRISSRELPPASDQSYSYPDSAGSGVTAYVIDTGVYIKHPEFQGRARIGKSIPKDGDRDGNGHGTHVAGTIGSKTYGVAKNVSIVAVKVLGNDGSGTTSDVIAGIEWAAKDVASKNGNGKPRKSVANMSLGGGASAALDRAVKAAIKNGLVFAVAAGNSGHDACQVSPGRVTEALTVAASDKDDNIASFSERGKCVDIIAPGVDITSTWNNGKINTISGTSMATPHVAGVVALALAEGNFSTVAKVHDYIKAVSSKDRIIGSLRGTPNSLLYNNVVGGKFPDNEPVEPQPQPEPEPEPPTNGECPIPQCLFDPDCTSCCVDCLWFSYRAKATN